MLSLISSSFTYTEHRNTMQPNATHSNPLQRTTTLPFPTVVHYPGHFHSMIRWESYNLNELLPVFNQKIRVFYLKRSYTLSGESYILSTYYTIFACAGQQSISSFDRKNGMKVESFPEPGDAFLDLPRTLRWYLLLSATHCNISATHCSSVSIQHTSTHFNTLQYTEPGGVFLNLPCTLCWYILEYSPQLTTTHYNTLQRIVAVFRSVPRTLHWYTLESSLQHTAANCSTLLQCDCCSVMRCTLHSVLVYIERVLWWRGLQSFHVAGTATHCNT